MQDKEHQPLSLIDVLTRNLLLFSIMFVAMGLGIAVQLLEKHSLDCHFLQIQSERLGFIFFIVLAACYVSLLFIFIKNQWLNFLVQLIVSLVLFILLIFVFNPNLKIDIYLGKYHGGFHTRSWEKVDDLAISEMVSFAWLQFPDNQDKLFTMGIACPVTYSYYLLNFVFTANYKLPLEKYKANKIQVGMACNRSTLRLIKHIPSREKALLVGDYKSFLQLDSNMDSKRLREKPLVIPIVALPPGLQQQLAAYAESKGEPLTQETVTPLVIREILERGK